MMKRMFGLASVRAFAGLAPGSASAMHASKNTATLTNLMAFSSSRWVPFSFVSQHLNWRAGSCLDVEYTQVRLELRRYLQRFGDGQETV
jgi:hypothetical protein